MIYFDSLCEIGPRNGKDEATPWSVDHVLHWMNLTGIDGALVSHTLARTDDPINARERLAEEISRAPGRLFPAWSLLPHHARDLSESPGQLAGNMRASGVRAVKLFPKSHRYPFVPALLGPFMEALEELGALVMIDYAEVGTDPTQVFLSLDAFLGAFPRLNVLLQRATWSDQRTISALMDKHDRLHIELSRMQHNRGIERYVDFFGPDRILFGSGLPEMNAGAARAFIDYAQIPEETKAKIAGRNLSNLLAGLLPRPGPGAKLDELRERACVGKPLDDIQILDAHCHVLKTGADSAGPYVMYQGDARGILELADTISINKIAIMSWSGPISSDMSPGNDVVAHALHEYPDRFLGVCYINPAHHKADELLAELRLRVDEQGFVALKPYPNIGLPYDHPLYAPCWEFANDRSLYVLCHTGGAAGPTDLVGELADRYPNVQWVIAHSGGSFQMARQVVTQMQDHSNIWAELTLTPVTNGVIEWMAREVGDERILFGTDAPMRDPRPQFGWVIWSDLPAESRKRILGTNFKRILNKVNEKPG